MVQGDPTCIDDRITAWELIQDMETLNALHLQLAPTDPPAYDTSEITDVYGDLTEG